MQQNDKQDIRSLSLKQLEEYFASIGQARFHAAQLHSWLWQKGASDFAQVTSLSKLLRERLEQDFVLHKISLSTVQHSTDGTIKNAVRLHDGLIVESVLIPAKDRSTACVSSQVGCAMACEFCATARVLTRRNLTAAEIVDQVTTIDAQSREFFGRPLSNIVFMGMGEPLLNYTQVMSAIDMITTDKGLGMSPRRITLSTVGHAKMIRRLADDGAKFNLAISLHSAIQQKRESMMPIAKTVNLNELLEAVQYWYYRTGRRVTYEYVVWDGINDSEEDLKALIRFCHQSPCKVNLIEYNAIGDEKFKKAGAKAMLMYTQGLERAGINTVLRLSKGKDIDAACGQLAGKVDIQEDTHI